MSLVVVEPRTLDAGRWECSMVAFVSPGRSVTVPISESWLDEAQLAAAAFLARYSERTLEAYRYDLRSFFQWAADQRLDVLAATRPHIECYRAFLEQRGLAASTIDRRLSTV